MTQELYQTIPHYQAAPPTEEQLEWADLAVIDLSKASTPEGRAELAAIALNAMSTIGFFYVTNHGLTSEQKDRIFDIADVPFAQVSDEEKQKYASPIIESGVYRGYKFRKFWHIDGGVRDEVEHYNINRDVNKAEHPEVLRPLLPEIDAFARHNHFNVLHSILRLLAIGLEIPEETFVNMHNFDATGETSVRFMKYYPRPQEDEERSGQVWLKGHTDIGSITILWSQPVSALQILSPDGKWRWIRHIDNALVINAGDCMEFLSGGFYKATIHRVIQPPVDQRGYTRVGAFYFAMPNDDVKLTPLADSPVLQEHGINRRFDDERAPTAESWRKGRTAAYGLTQLKKGLERGVETEYINGVLVKHYN